MKLINVEMPNRSALTMFNLDWPLIVSMRKSCGVLAAMVCLNPDLALAAQSGEIASASRGMVQISATVAARASVTAGSDVVFLRATQSQLLATVEQICVHSNTGSGFIDLIATGENNGTDFILTSRNGATVPMTLAWTDLLGRTQSLAPGRWVRTMPDNHADCELRGASTLSVLAPATGPVSTGVITLTLAPL